MPAAKWELTFYAEESVYPEDSALLANDSGATLHRYDGCLKGGLGQEDVVAATSEWDFSYDPNDGTHDFVVRGLGMEQSMQEAAGECSALNVDNLFTDPAVSLLTDDHIGAVPQTWADKPEVTDPPAVIEGDLQ